MGKTVHIANNERYEFTKLFLKQSRVPRTKLQFDDAHQSIDVNHALLADILAFGQDEQALLLPYWHSSAPNSEAYNDIKRVTWDYWCVAAASRDVLRSLLVALQRFIVPSYGQPVTGQPRYFDDSNSMNQLGKQLFPEGYYRISTRAMDAELVFERIHEWLMLRGQRPVYTTQTQQTYQSLLSNFNRALAAEHWQDARIQLDCLQQQNLTSAQNILFLEMRWLAQQGHWREIWLHPQWRELSTSRIPRTIRAALLTAYHHENLLEHEFRQDWDGVLNTFKNTSGQLGTLMQFRLDMNVPSVMRLFGYEAVLNDQAQNLSALLETASDTETHAILQQLSNRITPSSHSNLLQLVELMELRRFDEAWELLPTLDNPVRRIRNMVNIAQLSAHSPFAQQTINAYFELDKAVAEKLHQDDPTFETALNSLASLTPPAMSDLPLLDNWLSWLNAYMNSAGENYAYFEDALNFLQQNESGNGWADGEIDKLRDYLNQIYVDEWLRDTLIRNALDALISHFMNDVQFPQTGERYIDLYELLFTAAADRSYSGRSVNEVNSRLLLRLADTILWLDPERGNTLGNLFMEWFARPVPRLQQEVLTTFELLMMAGVNGHRLADLHRKWVEDILDRPIEQSTINLKAWYDLAAWVHAGQDIVDRLEAQHNQLIVAEDTDTPFIALRDDCQIGIFTLRTETALRAKERLLSQKPNLKITIFDMTTPDERAYALADNADIVVIVTACLKHTVYDGIKSRVSNPVLVNTSGMTGILRGIEMYAKEQLYDAFAFSG